MSPPPTIPRRSRPPAFFVPLLACVVLLSGCGLPWGGYAPRSYVDHPAWPAIVCLGDSLTAGDAAPANQSYPAWLQRWLVAHGYHYRVINAGKSGDRVADGLARLDADVLHYHPVVAIVELGSNDPGHTPPGRWGGDLGRIVARLRQHNIRVILGVLEEPGMQPVYDAVARRWDVPEVAFAAGLWSRPGLWGNAHHPNGRGYRVVMRSFLPALIPLLARRA